MISNIFISRKNTTIVLSIFILIIGGICMMILPISQLPEIAPPVVQVRATYPGATAQTIEETVITPLENQLNGIPGSMYMTSTSSNNGSASIDITFELGTNPDLAAVEVQNRVNQATATLPTEVTRTGLTIRKRSGEMLMVIGIYSPNETHEKSFLDNYTNIYIKPELSRVVGVGDISNFGQDYSMRVWLNPEKLASMGIATSDVITAIESQNMQVSAGTIGSPPVSGNQAFEYNISINGRLVTQEEFGEIIVGTNPANNSMVRLKDIAKIELGLFNYANNNRPMGKVGSGVSIWLNPGSNALETSEAIMKRMEELSASFPDDVEWIVPYETSSFVTAALDEVVKTFIEAMILVVFVVFVFLQNWRATLIPVIAIPLSLIGTFIFFELFDFSINTLTLFGFLLAIGIVVDDAIVVVEAVQHHIDANKLSPLDATLRAMREVQAPVIAMSLILAAVFVPVAFLPGVSGQLYKQFALTIAISVLISAIVALTLTPALCTLLLRPSQVKKDSKGINKIFYMFNLWFARVTQRYGILVSKLLRKIPVVLIVLIASFFMTYLIYNRVPTTFIPSEDMGAILVSVELPEGASLERTNKVMDQVADILSKDPAVKSFMASSGQNLVGGGSKSSVGTSFTGLIPWEERYKNGDDMTTVTARLQQKFNTIKEARIIPVPSPTIRGLGNSGGFTIMLQQKSGGTIEEFNAIAQQFLQEAGKRKEIQRAYTFFTIQTPEISVTVDRDKAEQMNVALTDVFSTVQTFLGSSYVNDFTSYARNFKVLVQADYQYRKDIKDIGKYFVRNRTGQMIPLETLITYHTRNTASVINHFNLYRSIQIDGYVAEGYSSGDGITALEETAKKTLPTGYDYEWANLSRQEIEAGNSSTLIFGLSILFVFLLLVALYESWSIPFSVLLTVPIAAFGAMFAMLISGQNNSVYSQIGLITLIGLAAKNAILIVEFAKEKFDSGMSLASATIGAIKLRFRPILMTSFAFILGIIPLTMSEGAGAAARVNVGVTVLGGMLAATFIAIFIIPVLFVFITKLTYRKKVKNSPEKTE
ncbi:multidrug efflux RND transporter permease subunit [Chryseobacterium sp.]|uniref:efflux RND transporter permease subunit n=1 Tax=Chryseobacterium sp. TaxID=1871047 RepID=UPI0025C0E6D4|nr:multidrug efflux RND transporter permease subunit [Chryseobacterium sp.]